MERAILRVDGISPSTKELLRNEALRLYGKPNASLMVRQLIASHLAQPTALPPPAESPGSQDKTTGRVELRLPRSVINELDARADARFSKRNYFINSLILDYLGQPQFQGDEIETLRKSNYELAKIGNNLNQVAKAFNILVSQTDPLILSH
jgi:hypothetical protein